MHPVDFAGANVTFAKDQPEYLPLPARRTADDPYGTVTTCWQMTWKERLRILLTGRVWLHQMTFHQPLQPQRPSVADD